VTNSELRQIRRRLGLTQRELGEQIGLTNVMIGQMERGESPIRLTTAMAAWCLLYESGLVKVGGRRKERARAPACEDLPALLRNQAS